MHSNPGYHPALARLIFPLLAGWLLGSGLQLQQEALFADWVYACLLLLAALLCALATLRTLALPGRSLIAVVAFSLLAFGVTGLRASIFLRDALDSGLEGHDIAVTGVVAAMPHRNDAGLRFRLEVEAAQLKGREVRLPPSIYLGWYAAMNGNSGAALVGPVAPPPGPVVAGERWRMTVRLKAPHGASNPFGFDYEFWLWEQGLQATGYVRAGAKDPAPLRLAQTFWHPVERARQQVRDRIFERVTERQYAGLIAALVVGDQNAIDRADWDIFRATGVAHLMSISGLHITMFAWIAALALGWLWRRSGPLCLWLPAPNAALIGGVLLASAYAFFSGWGVPSQRTVLMLATVALLRLSGKRWPWPQVWLLTCAVVVLMDPWALLQAGFWLSFVAVGVLFATDSGAKYTDRPEMKTASDAGPPQSETAPTGGRAAHLLASVGAMFHEQWVITLALTPLTLLLFGQVSVVGLVANALAIPWVTLVITPLAMLGVLAGPLWDLAAQAIAALVWYLKLLAALPFATITVAQAPLWAGFAGVVGGLLLAMKLPWSLRLSGLPLMLPVLLWQAPRPHEGQFELMAPDVGQGSAVIVRTASHALVYDAGPRFSRESDAGHRVLVPLLRALDLPVDLLVLSHRDSDHTGGALALLTMQTKAELLSSIEMDDELQALRPIRRCLAGQRWRWDGVDFEVLQPRAEDYDLDNKSNTMSCTLRISNGQRSALLTGDIEQAQEARLVAQGISFAAGPPQSETAPSGGSAAHAVASVGAIKTDLLLVPHHGSKSSSSAIFLDAVQPRIALVQAGYRNRFNHPAQSVLVRYEKRRIQVIDSPHCGAATWQSEWPQEIKCQRTQGLRYWHHRLP